MELIIKNKSQSFEQIVIDLNVYLRSLPDWESWQDYFKTGSGQTIVDLIAGLGAQLFYLINIQRQEVYLQTALNRSSVIGIAQMLGYSAGRGNSVKATITVKGNSTQVCNKFDVVGTVKGVDMIMADSILINEGETKQINIIAGTLKRDHVTVQSSNLQPFRLTKPNVSQDYMLYKTANPYEGDEGEADKSGWIELPTSEQMVDLSNDMYVVQTNVLSSVDLFYLNEGSGEHAYQYRSGDTLILEYVELSNTEFSITDLDFYYGEVISVDSVASYNAIERISSIKVNAPMTNETQSLIRARNDAKKLMQKNLNFLTSVNTRDISPEVVEVTYIKSDFTLLSELEYEQVYNYIFRRRAFGILMPVISPPDRSLLELTINVRLSNPLVRNTVINSIANMVDLLQGNFIIDSDGNPTKLDLEDMERQIEDLYGTKIARVYIKAPVYAADTYYRTGQFIKPNSTFDGIFKLDSISKESGTSEPTWTTTVGETVNDGQIQWICEEENGATAEWKASTIYTYSNIVLPTTPNGRQYKFNNYLGTSSSTEPTAPEEGSEVTYDGELVWFKIAKNPSAIEWEANTQYAIGTIVDISSDDSSSYELVTTRAKSSQTSIEWPSEGSITVDNMTWTYYDDKDSDDNYQNPLLVYEWNQYLHVEYDLTITE